MFGTLVVVLPSAHEGGEIVLNHCGTKKVFKSSEHTQSFACWYADVSHEILPVKSGYRCILTFNLAVDPASPKSASSPETAPPSASVQGAAKSVLRRGLQRWISVPARKQVLNKLVHVLDHEYNEASIALANLKGRDMAQVQALKELSEELPFEIFFGSMVRETIEYEYFDNGSDDDDGGITDEDFKCKTLFDLDNNKVMKHIEFSAEEQLDERHFEGVQEDDSKPGYEGNQVRLPSYAHRISTLTCSSFFGIGISVQVLVPCNGKRPLSVISEFMSTKHFSRSWFSSCATLCFRSYSLTSDIRQMRRLQEKILDWSFKASQKLHVNPRLGSRASVDWRRLTTERGKTGLLTANMAPFSAGRSYRSCSKYQSGLKILHFLRSLPLGTRPG